MYGTSFPSPMGGSSGYNSNPYSVRRPAAGSQNRATTAYRSTSPAQMQRSTTSTGAPHGLSGRVTQSTTSPGMPQRFPEPNYSTRGSLDSGRVTAQPTGDYADTPIPRPGRYESGARAAASPQEPGRRPAQTGQIRSAAVSPRGQSSNHYSTSNPYGRGSVAASPQEPASRTTQPQPRYTSSSQPQQSRNAADSRSTASPQAQRTNSYSPSRADRATTRSAQPQYPDTPLPGVRPQLAASPATPSSANGGRVLHTPTGPVFVLPSSDFRPTFSPGSPFVGRTVPPSYQAHRAKMGEIRKMHKDLLALMEQFGCSRVSRFTEYFNERFASFMFPKEDRDLMLKMDDQYATFHEIFGKSGDTFFDLMRDYQTYEKLVKMTHGPQRQDYSRQLEELEGTLSSKEREVESKISILSLQLKNFLFDLFSYMSKSSIRNINDAFKVFREKNHYYTNVVKAFKRPKTFAGMDYAYKDLIKSFRAVKGLDWLDSLVRAALVENAARNLQTYNNEPMTVDVKWLSDWVKAKMSSLGRNSPETDKALLKLKASVGCWDQLVTNGQSIAGTGSSIELFLRFSGMDTNTINYPLPGLNIAPKLQAQFDELNSEASLKSWVSNVEFFFDGPEEKGKLKLKSKYPEPSWRDGSWKALKENAVLIDSLKLTVSNPALVAKAEEFARKIVSYIYTHELTRDLQR